MFARWARKEGVTDRVLLAAVAEMESGLVDARLGGGLFKKRVGLPGGGKLEFILAVPGRRYTDFAEILEPLHQALCADAKQEVVGETTWNGLRLIVAHDPQVATEMN